MSLAVALAFLMSAAQPAEPSVEVAGGDWSSIPRMAAQGDNYISKFAIERVQEIFSGNSCTIRGQSRNKLDLTVPFLVQFDPGGAPQRIIVRKVGCPQLETLLGGVVLHLVKRGEYRPTGENLAGWYQSDVSFALR